MKKTILIAAIAALTFGACKDKAKEETKPQSSLSAKQTLLMGKDWKIKSVMSEGIDVTPFIEDCIMDNTIYRFTDASVGFSDEGATKCDEKDPQKINFTWKLENNETKMIITDAESKDTFNLLNVTASELKISADQDIIILKH